jgi:hypothetical protein
VKASRPGTAGLLAQRLIALFMAGWALFDFPLLGLGFGAGTEATLFGLPRLPVLLFAGWAALIVLLAWLMERADGEEAAERGAGLPEAGREAVREVRH